MEDGKQSEKMKDERERNRKRVPFNCSMEEEVDQKDSEIFWVSNGLNINHILF